MTEEQLTRGMALHKLRELTQKALERINGDTEWGLIPLGEGECISVRQMVIDGLEAKIEKFNKDLREL